MAAEPGQQQLRNLRDFLLVYNKMTESCFNKCVTNLNYRGLTQIEESCINGCAGKLIRTNHRLMGAYVQLMPAIVQKRLAEYERRAAEIAPAAPVTEVAPAAPVTEVAPAAPVTEVALVTETAPAAPASSQEVASGAE